MELEVELEVEGGQVVCVRAMGVEAVAVGGGGLAVVVHQGAAGEDGHPTHTTSIIINSSSHISSSHKCQLVPYPQASLSQRNT